ncbi:MAG: SUMF1/EgtB/PvdO family nonheme iron enzyme [Myxococcales bacterium]|nr:SUMF1/EgtB/PvdO family nonheme iron enzyme [Myxococcales bacterium]
MDAIPDMWDAVILYAGPDGPAAKRIHEGLQSRGRRVFIDRGLAPGRSWPDEICRAIYQSRYSVILASSAWRRGHYNHDELVRVISEHRRRPTTHMVLCVDIEPGLHPDDCPYGAASLTRIEWSDAGIDGAIERLEELILHAADDAVLADRLAAAEKALIDTLARGADPVKAQLEVAEAKLAMRRGGTLRPLYVLGDYTLLEPLGAGGFAQVWRAVDRRQGHQIVALKVLHGHWRHDRSKRDRFFRGATRMSQIAPHDNVVRVLQPRGEADGFCFYAMELIDGDDLAAAIERGRVPADRVPGIIGDIGAALSAAHAKGIIHRDVKPENVMLPLTGPAKLTDFDLVLAPDSRQGTLRSTMGTPLFAAPETHGNAEHADERSDLYGLAMTAVYCWHSGHLPTDWLKDKDAVIDGLPCRPAQRKALRQALDPLPANRWPSVRAFCEALADDEAQIARRAIEGAVERKHHPLSKLASALPADLFDAGRWNGEVLEATLRTLRSADAALHERAVRALNDWVSPKRTTRQLAFVWYALEGSGSPPHRADFFERCGRPLPTTELPWVSVPGGTFEMGGPRGREHPRHRVTLSPFEMASRLVTVAEFLAFDPRHRRGGLDAEACDRFPVQWVTWWDAYLFSRWHGARLPTEAEWEYACRAGSATRHPWGDDGADATRYAWFKDNADGRVRPVQTREPNAFGLHDMQGLLWEWCADWYGDYDAAAALDPKGPAKGEKRVLRGGSFKSNADTLQSSHRERNKPDHCTAVRGLRLARDTRTPTGVPGQTPLIPPGTSGRPARISRRGDGVQPVPRQSVFDTYWRFAAKRQWIFYRRLAGSQGPWSDDPILQQYKFCNAYRASDRVSQFLIRRAIYGDGFSTDVDDVVFRTLLFRLFNKNETWSAFERAFGEPRARDFSPERYSSVLDRLMDDDERIFGSAYMIAPPQNALGRTFDRKHDGYLFLLQTMLREGIGKRVAAARSLEGLYQLLLGYPLIGKFMAYQIAIDLNYTEVVDFDENSFTQAGPGAVRGIAKCFEDTGRMTDRDVINWMVDHQEAEFLRLGIDPKSVWLWGRPLKAIDCQNLFCETDKYCRVAFPDLKSNRKRIKASFNATPQRIAYFYPPKWGLNGKLDEIPSVPPIAERRPATPLDLRSSTSGTLL